MAVTSSGNIVVKEDISVEDTEKELQTSKYNFTSCSAKADQPNFELLQYWPESLEENPVERILIQQPENCDGDTMKLEEQDDVVLQELVPYWPITDTVKIGMHMFSEHSEVKTEFEQELCAEKNLSESSTEIYKNSLLSIDAKSVTENFSKNYFHYNVENDVLPSTSEYNNLDRNGQCSNCNTKCECKCKTLKDAKPKCHTCDICNKSFTRRYRLVRHKLIHDKGSCGENIITERYSDMYKNGLVGGDDKSVIENFSKSYFYCSVGNNKPPGTSEYNDSKRNNWCSKCDTRSECKCKTQNITLKDAKPKFHTCDICNKSFPYLSKLARHKMIHVEVRNFSCQICNKSFRHPSSLVKHKLIHSDNKNFSCDV